MKRHPALLQLSREHHTALKLALDCRKARESADGAAEAALLARIPGLFAAELEPHFQCEETDLLPQLEAVGETALVRRTLEEHRELRRLVACLGRGEAAALLPFAELLQAHVRFEERELFEQAQRYPAFAVA